MEAKKLEKQSRACAISSIDYENLFDILTIILNIFTRHINVLLLALFVCREEQETNHKKAIFP
jgi:hypothetical protein